MKDLKHKKVLLESKRQNGSNKNIVLIVFDLFKLYLSKISKYFEDYQMSSKRYITNLWDLQ